MQIPQADRHNKTEAEKGFTIVETLVALFVFALTGVALALARLASSTVSFSADSGVICARISDMVRDLIETATSARIRMSR